MTGTRPLAAGDLYDYTSSDEVREGTRREIASRIGRTPTDEELDFFRRETRADLYGKPSALMLSRDKLESAVVLSAEEVADYWATLPKGTNTLDLVASVAPPFDSLFVEFQHRTLPHSLALTSWGVLLIGERTDEGWLLRAELVGEWRKGKPVGPIAGWVLPLDADGVPAGSDSEGHGSIFALPLDIPDVPDEIAYEYLSDFAPWYLSPALFAVSLMHCKNVDLRPVDPPERLSRKHKSKTGRPLTRYYVLGIQPMRRVLDTEGEAQARGLGHALHICRGHFKTYTEDSPLFGKHTGTYWWESQARGKAEHGIVEKDYRIRLDQGLGREYVEADEHAEMQPTAPEHTGIDPDLGGRGLRAHNVTQNLLARAVREAGHEPRRPKPDEPQYDLAWEAGDVTWVAEVKSITPQNEERQLRLGLGQVLRYRQLLEEEGRTVRAMIATEVMPTDPTWSELCVREEITLVWGPDELTVG